MPSNEEEAETIIALAHRRYDEIISEHATLDLVLDRESFVTGYLAGAYDTNENTVLQLKFINTLREGLS